ncbi:MAG: TSUP family transporter [Synergistaceae bacterium]|nr:TSUP family transporter [Synergistaceae bacterium]
MATIFFLCAMVFFAGFVDAAAGGGGLISLPAYLFTGAPAHVALGSNKFSSSCGATFSAGRFFAKGAMDLKAALLAAASSFVGSIIGARAVLYVDAEALRVILAAVLPVAAGVILFKRGYGERNLSGRLSKRTATALSLSIGFLTGAYDGLLGPGAGSFAIIAFTALMKYDLKTASGNAKVLNLASNYGSLAVFALSGTVDYAIALPAGLCSIAGHYIGAGYAIKRGAAFIRPLMIFVMALLFCKILFDVFVK